MTVADARAAVDAAIAADRAHADPALWITRVPDAVLRAQAADLSRSGAEAGPLFGTVIAIKDNIDVAGLPTTAACPGYAYVAERDAPAVARLRAAGALVMGKTNLDQFATGLVGVRSPYGVPRNVFDPARVPGGSSSGSATAVAAGIVPVALGTDTAGSGRVPAMFGNVVGLKPTIGSVSARGLVPACRSIDTISVFAGSVDAALAVQRVIAGFDPDDPYAKPPPFAHLRRGMLPPTLRLGCVDPSACDPAVAAVYDAVCTRHGGTRVDIAPLLAIARLLYEGPWVAERTAAFRTIVEQQPDMLFPATRTVFDEGLTRRTVDAFPAFDQLAQARRYARMLFASLDALLLPTAPFCPSLAMLADDPIGPNARLGTYTNFANLCDLAGWAVPAGFGSDGLPVGVTILGPAWSEGRLAAITDSVHRLATDRVGGTSAMLPPAAQPDPLAAEETALFCVGAHMAGLPLNGQLTALGGRFVRETETTPDYSLHLLGSRPGLLRVQAGGGATPRAIPGEVWALPQSAIGSLLAQVPPPLGFGTVALREGPCLGFLAEAAAIGDAPAIAGWRSHLNG